MGKHISQIKDVLKQEVRPSIRRLRVCGLIKVERAVELLVVCRDQVVLAGVGKSGFCARSCRNLE